MSQSRDDGDNLNRKVMLDNTHRDGRSGFDVRTGEQERRGVLGGMLGSVAAAVGLSSTASAEPERTGNVTPFEQARALEGLQTPESLRAAVGDHTELLSELSDADVLEEASVDALELDAIREPHPDRDGEGEVLTARRLPDGVTPEVKLFRETGDGVLSVVVFPEVDHSYAILNFHEDGKEPAEFGDGPLATSDDVTTQGCSDSCKEEECSYECCNCCGCDPCDQCFSCTCGYCYTCDCVCQSGCCSFGCAGGCV